MNEAIIYRQVMTYQGSEGCLLYIGGQIDGYLIDIVSCYAIHLSRDIAFRNASKL